MFNEHKKESHILTPNIKNVNIDQKEHPDLYFIQNYFAGMRLRYSATNILIILLILLMES